MLHTAMLFGKINEHSRYKTKSQKTDRNPKNRLTPDRFGLTFTVRPRMKNTPSVIYHQISGTFYLLSESLWKKKKERLSSLSISYIKEWSVNSELQAPHPLVITHRLNYDATVSLSTVGEFEALMV